ncbi:hypothetical protein E2986_11576 [Frieseomelitta varia]|uniref:Uncharacterized protein n=1 Tax=Frieseomelitta varia TaxID=561572 RepID=A0A833SFW1_9HYME|nr:hypothetical protein E2986_11576 [Frieseomelitta varia]
MPRMQTDSANSGTLNVAKLLLNQRTVNCDTKGISDISRSPPLFLNFTTDNVRLDIYSQYGLSGSPGPNKLCSCCSKGSTCSVTFKGISEDKVFSSCVHSLHATEERKITCNIHREAGIEQQLVVELLRPASWNPNCGYTDDPPVDSVYMIIGVLIALVLVGVIIVLLAVTIRGRIICILEDNTRTAIRP